MEAMFNSSFTMPKPVIYADVNVFRYLAYGELEIVDPERFVWSYSSVHLDEMHRGGNTDALKGMAALKAVEVRDVLDKDFKSNGNVRILDYIDPTSRYESHLDAISGTGDSEDLIIEHLLRIFGADNFSELSMTPEKLVEEIDRLTTGIDDSKKEELRNKVNDVSIQMAESIDEHLSNRMPIDDTRNAMGVSSEARKTLEKSKSPIDEIWKLIEPTMIGTDKDVFFGFRPNPVTPEIPHTQHGAIGSGHIVLNMIGFNPDKGLANRNKIKNILSDSQHLGMASYCQGLLSSDFRLCNKANAIYEYLGLSVRALHYKYDPNGMVVNLGIQKSNSAT
jgi:hypothetical protein